MPATPPASPTPNDPARAQASRGTPTQVEARADEFAAELRQRRGGPSPENANALASDAIAIPGSDQALQDVPVETIPTVSASVPAPDADMIAAASEGATVPTHSARSAPPPGTASAPGVGEPAGLIPPSGGRRTAGRSVPAEATLRGVQQERPAPTAPAMATEVRLTPVGSNADSPLAGSAVPPRRPTDSAVAPFVVVTDQPRSALAGTPEATAAPNALAVPSPAAQPTQGQAATITAPASAPLPAAPATQLGQAILARGTPDTIEVRLDPPSLGQVRVSFDFAGEVPRAVVAAAQPETLDQLRRSASALLTELAEAGLGDTELSWSDERLPPDDRPEGGRPFLVATGRGGASPAGAAPPPARRHDGALDLTF